MKSFLNTDKDEHAQEEIIEGLQNVQLDKLRFQVDTTGIHFLLDGQTHLQKLDCSSHFERSRLKARDFPKLMESLWRGLRQSRDTIRHAHAIGTVAFSSDDEDQNTLLTSNPCFNINLETFENSSGLTNLWLSKMENFPSNSRFFPESFTFSNSQCIPTSLVQLELWVGRVIPEELVKLTLRLQQMMNLCFLKLCSVVPYFISLECFKNILSVEHSFMQAFFYNGFLHEDFCPQQIIMNNRRANRRNWEVKISKGGCEFVCKEPIPRF
ncbi:unnamed protein product [Allacma fusca]|uniref:Uncharacterized protein n=1 Tax=Allacma fusca TaxID=39272 RepID=A0A8J2LJQ1_9HEXA|nr:unnamed protein product [Allacma fusca]